MDIDVIAEDCIQKGAKRRLVKETGEWCGLGRYDLNCPCLDNQYALVSGNEIYYKCKYRNDPLFYIQRHMEPRGWRG